MRGSNPRRVTKPGVLDLQELRGFSLCFQCFLGFLHVLNALVKNNLCWQKSVNLQMNLQMKTLTFPIWKERRFFSPGYGRSDKEIATLINYVRSILDTISKTQ